MNVLKVVFGKKQRLLESIPRERLILCPNNGSVPLPVGGRLLWIKDGAYHALVDHGVRFTVLEERDAQ